MTFVNHNQIKPHPLTARHRLRADNLEWCVQALPPVTALYYTVIHEAVAIRYSRCLLNQRDRSHTKHARLPRSSACWINRMPQYVLCVTVKSPSKKSRSPSISNPK